METPDESAHRNECAQPPPLHGLVFDWVNPSHFTLKRWDARPFCVVERSALFMVKNAVNFLYRYRISIADLWKSRYCCSNSFCLFVRSSHVGAELKRLNQSASNQCLMVAYTESNFLTPKMLTKLRLNIPLAIIDRYVAIRRSRVTIES